MTVSARGIGPADRRAVSAPASITVAANVPLSVARVRYDLHAQIDRWRRVRQAAHCDRVYTQVRNLSDPLRRDSTRRLGSRPFANRSNRPSDLCRRHVVEENEVGTSSDGLLHFDDRPAFHLDLVVTERSPGDIDRFPDAALFWSGTALNLAGLHDHAITLFEYVVERMPDSAEAWQRLGSGHSARGKARQRTEHPGAAADLSQAAACFHRAERLR